MHGVKDYVLPRPIYHSSTSLNDHKQQNIPLGSPWLPTCLWLAGTQLQLLKSSTWNSPHGNAVIEIKVQADLLLTYSGWLLTASRQLKPTQAAHIAKQFQRLHMRFFSWSNKNIIIAQEDALRSIGHNSTATDSNQINNYPGRNKLLQSLLAVSTGMLRKQEQICSCWDIKMEGCPLSRDSMFSNKVVVSKAPKAATANRLDLGEIHKSMKGLKKKN